LKILATLFYDFKTKILQPGLALVSRPSGNLRQLGIHKRFGFGQLNKLKPI